MRVLVDHDVYASTVRALEAAGHDVMRSVDVVGARAADREVLEAAARDDRVLVSRDLDFGRLVLVQPPLAVGVVILRFRRASLAAVHEQLLGALAVHTTAELQGAVLVVEGGRHRLRRLQPEGG